jgi:hypothetical protein
MGRDVVDDCNANRAHALPELAMSTTAEQRFRAFVDEPTPHRFRWLQRRIMASADYEPLALPLAELGELFMRARYGEVLEHVGDLADVWQLSPRLHLFAGLAADELGNSLEADQHRTAMQACLHGLLGTGDGTRKRPFSVTYLTDEMDVMKCLQQSDARCQKLIAVGTKQCDVITCHDGSDVWFDVTRLLARMPRRFRSSKPARSAPSAR